MEGNVLASHSLTKLRILARLERSSGRYFTFSWPSVLLIVTAAELGSVREAITTRYSGCSLAIVRAQWKPRPVVPPVIKTVWMKDMMMKISCNGGERMECLVFPSYRIVICVQNRGFSERICIRKKRHSRRK